MKLQNDAKIGIIGGKGKTGSQFVELFKKLGFSVVIADIGTKVSNDDVMNDCDIVLFAVPLHLSEKILKNEAKKSWTGQLLLDVSSLKEKQVKAMQVGKAEVVGMHPLFGPSRRAFDGLSMVLCPGRCEKETVTVLRKLFEKLGMKIVVMTPKKHDQLMAAVQVIPHLKTILAGEMFKNLNLDPGKSYGISTPIYKLELDIIGRIFSQDAELYGTIIAQNPYSKKLLKDLKKTIDEYEVATRKGDVKALSRRFNSVKKFLGTFPKQAFARSEKIINEIRKWD